MKAKWLYAMAAVALMAVQAGASTIDFYTLSPSSMDIGNPAGGDPQAGSDSYDSGTNTYTINAYGSDWWDGNGECAHIVYVQAMAGNWRIETEVTRVTTPDGWTKAGVFVRNNLLCGDNPDKQQINAVMCQTGSNGSSFQVRAAIGANMSNTQTPDTTKVALQRYNDKVTGYYWNGSDWVQNSSTILALVDQPYIGLFLTSHNNGAMATATYTNTVLTDAVAPAAIPQSVINDVRAGGWHKMGIREALKGPGLGLNPGDPGAPPDNLSQAVDFLNGDQSGNGNYYYDAPVINIWDSDGNGRFGGDSPFGIVTNGWRNQGGVDRVALVAGGNIRIVTAGYYTFDVNSDDGFELGIDGALVGNFTSGRGSSDTLMQTYLTAGDHPFQLIYWEGMGGASVELSAAAGAKTGFDSDFHLVGDTASGGMELVPEPATLVLLGLGAAATFIRRRRR